MRVYVDLDGVLSDFERGVQDALNMTPDFAEKVLGASTYWNTLRDLPQFYTRLPWMPNGKKFWAGVVVLCSQHGLRPPAILSGCPRGGWAESQKEAWVHYNIEETVEVFTCQSHQKARFASKGAVLIDDWTIHAKPWTSAGGVMILHRDDDWEQSLAQLKSTLKEWRAK